MSEPDQGDQGQQKFEFYVVGLIFTLLVASVHTAEFKGSVIPDALELIAWFALLLAGLLGLWRLQWMPSARATYLNREVVKNERSRLRKARAEQTRVVLEETAEAGDVDALIDKASESIEVLTRDYDRMMGRLVKRYSIAQWFFVIGVSLLVVARASAPTANLLEQAYQAIRVGDLEAVD